MQAQFLKKLGKRATKAAENTVMQRTDQEVTKETDKALDTLLSGKKGQKPKTQKKSKGTKNQREESGATDDIENTKNEHIAQESPRLWSKYNFVPGDEIIFYDDLEGEENGEFPSRWDILKGNAENAELEGENVIAMKQYTLIYPLMDSDNYLPEVFTLEFDAFFDAEAAIHGFRYYLNFWPGQKGYFYFDGSKKDYANSINFYENRLQFDGQMKGSKRNFSTIKSELDKPTGHWKHFAIAFNKRSLKIFIDEYRVLNLPNLGFKPKMFSIGCHDQWDGNDVKVRAIKNIRLAQGGKKLYDQILEEGRFVTRGILFDVNKATLKPESMGVINQVAKLMQERIDLKFEIVGHTDAQGDDGYNLELSAQRANSVRNVLMEKGIENTRLKATGMGEKIPVADNATAEGRANNRRVEFVKMGNF